MRLFLKTIIKTLLLLLFFASSIQAQSVISLSDRLGTVISSQARDYFGLFPKIEDFESAVLKQDGVKFYFQIKTKSGEIKKNVSDSTVQALKLVIENFEKIINTENRKKSMSTPEFFWILSKLTQDTSRINQPLMSFCEMESKSMVSSFFITMNICLYLKESLYTIMILL